MVCIAVAQAFRNRELVAVMLADQAEILGQRGKAGALRGGFVQQAAAVARLATSGPETIWRAATFMGRRRVLKAWGAEAARAVADRLGNALDALDLGLAPRPGDVELALVIPPWGG